MKNEQGFTYLPQTGDVCVFNIHAAKFRENGAFVNIVLIKRKNEPFKDTWALPGGFLNEGETVQECAARELEEETGIRAKMLIPIGTYSDPKRDPRGQVISNAFAVVIPTTDSNPLEPKAKDDAADIGLFNLKGSILEKENAVDVNLRCVENGVRIVYRATFSHGPFGILKADIEYKDGNAHLAFDHAEMIARAITKMPAIVSTDADTTSKVMHSTPANKDIEQIAK